MNLLRHWYWYGQSAQESASDTTGLSISAASLTLSFCRCRKALSCFHLCICPLASPSGNKLSLSTLSPAKCGSPARSPGRLKIMNPRLLFQSRASWRRPALKKVSLRQGWSLTASLPDSEATRLHLLQLENILQLQGLLPPGGKEWGRTPPVPLRDLADPSPWLRTACQRHLTRETSMNSFYKCIYSITDRVSAPRMWWMKHFAGCLKIRDVQKDPSRRMGRCAPCHPPRCVFLCVFLSCISKKTNNRCLFSFNLVDNRIRTTVNHC